MPTMQLEEKRMQSSAGPTRSNLTLGLSKTLGQVASGDGRGLLGHDPE
jgi:hypothetical protein